MDQALLFHIFGFGVSLWLGLYIINRDPRNLRLTYTGASLVSFALGLCLDALQHYATTAILGADLARASGLFFLIAPLFWAGATVHSLPEDSPRRMFFVRIWHLGLLPVVAIAYFLAVMAGMAPGGQTDTSASGPLYDTFAFFIIIPLILVAIYFWATTRDANFMQLKRILLIGTSLLTVETACLFFPSMWFPRQSAIALGGLTLVILGATLAILDARDEGEAFLPHIVRSLDYSFFTALLFGGQVALAMLWLGGISLPMLVLLFTSVGTAIAVQIFAEPVQLILDKVAFARFPRLRKVRAQLRAAAEALPRLNDTLDLESLDETEFTRLTRRALSHFGSLHRLAASPLTQLPIVRVRLAERGADSTTLDSAAELSIIPMSSV